MPSHIVDYFEDREGFEHACAAEGLNHGSKGSCSTDSCTAVDHDHLFFWDHAEGVFNQWSEESLRFGAEGFPHIAPSSPLARLFHTWLCSRTKVPSLLWRISYVLWNSSSSCSTCPHVRLSLGLSKLMVFPGSGQYFSAWVLVSMILRLFWGLQMRRAWWFCGLYGGSRLAKSAPALSWVVLVQKWTILNHLALISCSWHWCKSREPSRVQRDYGNLNGSFSTSFDIAVSIFMFLSMMDVFFVVVDLSVIE